MKKNTLLNFIKKHTSVIEKCRWVSSAVDKTLKVDVLSDTKNLLCDLTLKNWDGFGDAEIGIGSLTKFEREFNGVYGEDITFVLNYNDDKTRIYNIDVMDGVQVNTITVSDVDMIAKSSRLKNPLTFSAEIVLNEEFKDRFLQAKASLPDVNTFTLLMNKKKKLELVIGYSKNNSSRTAINVTTTNGLDSVDGPLHFRADYLKEILNSNSGEGDSVLKVADSGVCAVSFDSTDFKSNYYLTVTEDQD